MLVQLLTGYNFLNWYLTLRSFHYSLYVRVYCPGDVHWARLEASALGSLIAWKRREERAGKTRMIGLTYGEKNYDDMLSRFHLILERYGRTDRFAISISRVSMLMRDKN